MKKVTLLIAIMTVYSLIFAQSKFSNTVSKDCFPKASTAPISISQYKIAKSATNNTNYLAKQAIGDTIFYEGFSGGFPGTWTNTLNGGPGGWNYTTTGSAGEWRPGNAIASTTSGDGWMIMDGDAHNNPGGGTDIDAMFTTEAIDLTGFSSVILRFEHFHTRCCANSGELVLAISNDNVNWMEWDMTNNVPVNGTSANPIVENINISCIAGGQSTVYIRFHWKGLSHYWWQIDDILLLEAAPEHDLAIDNEIYLDPWLTPVYTMIPIKQTDTTMFSAIIENIMPFTETNVELNVVVNDGTNDVFNETSAPITVTACLDSTFTQISSGFLVSNIGNYSIEMNLSFDSTDGDMSNNTISHAYEVTDSIFARDDGTPTGGAELYLGLYINVTPPYEFGNWFETTNNDTATSISVLLGPGSLVGALMRGRIYDDGLPSPTVLAETTFYTILSGDPGTWITLPLQSPFSLNSFSNYVVTIADFSGTDSAVTIAADPGAAPGTSYLGDNTGFGYINAVPFVRLNTTPPSVVCNLGSTAPSITSVGCYGGSDGAVTGISATGGTSSYTYAWPNGSANPDSSGMAAGVYTMTITDANSCTYNLAVEITEPDMLVVSEVVTDITCNGLTDGMVDASATGGNLIGAPAVTIFYDDFESGTMGPGYTLINNDGLTPAGGVAALGFNVADSTAWLVLDDGSGTNLVAQSTSWYSPSGTADDWLITDVITLTNNNVLSWDARAFSSFQDGYEVRISTTTPTIAGCLANAALFSIPAENIAFTSRSVGLAAAGYANQTVYIAFRNNSTDMERLFIDNIKVEKLAVASAYQYSFDGGAYSTTSSFTGVSAGTYNLIVKDASGCLDSVSVNVTAPSAMTFGLDSTTAVCGLNGSGTVTPLGGTAPFTYLWDDPNTQTDSVATGLLAGTYSIAVTDAMGCIDTAILSVAETPPVIMTVGAVVPTSCTAGDGIAYVNVTSGTAPFGYQWSPTGGFQDSATGLSAGIYTILVIDSFGCQNTGSITLVDGLAPNINVTDSNDVNCFGDSDGDATASVSGGTGPYDYYWSNGDSTIGGGLTNLVTGLSAGSFTVTVTDANSCSNFASVSISEPSTAVNVDSISSTDISCNGLTDGTAMVGGSGGTGILTYAWTSGGSTPGVSGLGSGTEMVTITDAKGCTDTASVIITDPPALSATSVKTDIKCNGDGDGAIDLTVTGGTGSYTYAWSNSAIIEDLTGLGANTFTVTVTDENGCTANAISTITEPAALVVTVSVTDETQAGANDGTINATVTGGTGAGTYNYSWNLGQTTPLITNLAPGTYMLTVTDGNGCTTTSTDTVKAGPIGIEDVVFNLAFNVYPNPNDGNFVLVIHNLKSVNYNLEVRNIIGQLVYSDVISNVTGDFKKEVNMSNQERGVYFLSIINEEGKRTEKLIIF